MIKDAVQNGDILELDIGTTTVIRSYADINDFDNGYIYNIGIGQGVTIPISNIEDYGPRFTKVGELTISAGSTITTLSAGQLGEHNFAVLLVRAFKLTSENTENFADVLDSDYFAEELAIARNTGLVNGIGENKFAPRNNITRQDMMVIVYRALAGMNKLNVGDGVLDVPQASDFEKVAGYAKKAVSALVNEKLVNGKNGKIAPTDYTTRAEVAVLIKRILDYTK